MGMGDSPAPVAKCDIEWIGLGRLARLRDETVRVEHHGVLVDFGVVHEVPTCSREQPLALHHEEKGAHQMFAMTVEPLGRKYPSCTLS